MSPSLIAALATIFTCCVAIGASRHGNSTPSAHSWAGSNLYFLHALPVDQQVAYVSTLAGWKAKVIRLWVTGCSSGCVKGSYANAIADLEPAVVGTYDTSVLAALDVTLGILHSYGIKAIISPHDAGVINGANGCDVYCTKYGDQDTFYASSDAVDDYEKRLVTILTYKSPHFGKQWGQLDEVILAFDIQNEPMINAVSLLEANDPNDWLCGRATTMKSHLDGSNIEVATGGIGGSQYCCDHEYNILDKALGCKSIDIMSVHGYMSKATDWAYFVTGDKSVLDQVEGSGKNVMVEEWGVSSSSTDNFNTQVEVFNNAGLPWLYWQIIPGLDQTQSGAPSSGGYDGYEIGINSTKGNVATGLEAARAAPAAQAWCSVV